MGITLDELLFDPSNPDDGSNVGAYLRGADGTVIGNVSDALKVDIGSVTDLDIRNLTFANDKVDASGSVVALDAATLAALENITVTVDNSEVEISNDAGNPIPVNGTVTVQDGGGSVTVDAVDFDIRNLVFADDKVDASGSEVKQDSYDNLKNSAQSVTTTASALAGTPLANRVKMLIQNLGNKEIWIGSDNTVTSANGIKISAGGSGEFMFSAASTPHAISSGTSDVRILEMAY